jgi:C4-dicarboxylate transporter
MSLLVILGVVILVFLLVINKKIDASIAFVIGGVVIFTISNNWAQAFEALLGFRWIIVSSLVIVLSFGFAGVLRSENYIQETIHVFRNLLRRSNSRTRILYIMMGVIVTWLCCFTLMSASAACGMVAPIFYPIFLRIGLSPKLIGICIISGAWGSIVHPGDINCNSVNLALESNHLPIIDPFHDHLVPAIGAILIIILIIKRQTSKWKNVIQKDQQEEMNKSDTQRSVVSLLPFILLVAYALVHPVVVAVVTPDLFRIIIQGSVNSILTKGAVIISIIISCICAFRLAIRQGNINLQSAFVKGAVKGIIEVVLLIIASNFFIAALKTGIGEERIYNLLNGCGKLITPIAIILTLLFAALTGSGDAIVISIVPLVISGLKQFPVVPVQVACSMIWFSGELGRCISPVSAATLTVSKVTTIDSKIIAKSALVPVLSGLLVSIILLCLQSFLS